MEWSLPYALSSIPLVVVFAIWAQYRYAVSAAPRAFARMLRALALANGLWLLFPVLVAFLGGNIWGLWACFIGGYTLVSLVAYAAMRRLGVGPSTRTTPRIQVTRR